MFLVRHGETDYNQQRKFQGQLNIPLNQNGIMQAEKSAKYIQAYFQDKFVNVNENIEVICSDLLRAKQTCQIICEKLKVTCVEDKRFREAKLGIIQGMFFDDIIKLYGEEKFKQLQWWDPNNHTVLFAGAETCYQVNQRFTTAIKEAVKNLQDKKYLVVVTHSGPLRGFLKTINPDKKDPWKINNADVIKLYYFPDTNRYIYNPPNNHRENMLIS